MQPYRYSDERVKGPHADILNSRGRKVTEGCLVLRKDELVWERFGDMSGASKRDLKKADKLLQEMLFDDQAMEAARTQVDSVIEDLMADLSHRNQATRELAARRLEYFKKMRTKL